MRWRRCTGGLLFVALAAACSSHATTAPPSKYWDVAATPRGLVRGGARLEPYGYASFAYGSAHPHVSASITAIPTRCRPPSGGQAHNATKVGRKSVTEWADVDDGKPFGWTAYWNAGSSVCVEVTVDMSGPSDVAQARRIAHTMIDAARPTTYATFRARCLRWFAHDTGPGQTVPQQRLNALCAPST